MSPHKLGFIQGIFAAIVLGFMMRFIKWRLDEIMAMFHPQRVVQVTKRTPWQIVSWALFLIICVFVLLVAPACVRDPASCANLGALLLLLLRELASFFVVVVQTLLQIIQWLFNFARDFLS